MAIPNALDPTITKLRFDGGSAVILCGALSGSATIIAVTGVVGNGSIYMSTGGTSGEIYVMQLGKWIKVNVNGSS